METGQTPPILFLVFNRPDLAARVFARIREARPARLFVAADGPRPAHPEDIQACRETRLLAERVDWPCEVKTLFREKNLGCRLAISAAIIWFFEHVEEGIILEDDCLPDPSFFPYCAELLARYRNDERIATISGEGYPCRGRAGNASYYFSAYQLIWGWATWRRAWRHYNPTLTAGSCLFDPVWLRRFLGNDYAAAVWRKLIADYHAGRIESWAYPWNFSCWANHGLCAVPAINMVANIGFSAGATHTRDANSPLARRPVGAMTFPLRHPRRIRRNGKMEREYEKYALPAQRTTQRRTPVFVKNVLAACRRLATAWPFRYLRKGNPESNGNPASRIGR